MSQHPNASPSPIAGEIAAVIGEFVTAQANAMHAVARLAMLTRDLVEGTAPQTSAPEVRQEIADLAQRLPPVAAEPRTNRAERREMILDLYATTDLTGHAIARRAGVVLDTPRKIIRKAREAGDRRAAQGDLRRQPAADQAAPSPAFPSTPHDGLPENGGNASPEWPVESGASGICPAEGEEVVPVPGVEEAAATAVDPAPAPESDWTKPIGIIVASDPAAATATVATTPTGRSAIDALRAANKRILHQPSEMELADELDDEPQPRRPEPEARRGPAGLAQRVAARVERPQEPVKPATKAIPLTEAEVGMPILHVDRKAKTVIGPLGTWGGCTDIVLTVMDRLADGNLYGQPVLQKLAGFNRPETFNTVLKRWKEELQAIGVEMYSGPAGVRLQRQEIV